MLRSLLYSSTLAFAGILTVRAAGCPNGGSGLGYWIHYDNDWVRTTYTVISKDGTCNKDSYRVSPDGDGCGGGYTGGASVQCDDNKKTISIRPPGYGPHICQPARITCDDNPKNVARITWCCYAL